MPKMSYMAKAPWDQAGQVRLFARRVSAVRRGELRGAGGGQDCGDYRPERAGCIDLGRMWPHPALQRRGRRAEWNKAVRQLAVIDEAIASTTSADCKARLRMLRAGSPPRKTISNSTTGSRSTRWADLPGAMESWAHNFMYRVNDISSLGNVTSTQNRFVQENYVAKENQLRKALAIQPPAEVAARGLRQGASSTGPTKRKTPPASTSTATARR